MVVKVSMAVRVRIGGGQRTAASGGTAGGVYPQVAQQAAQVETSTYEQHFIMRFPDDVAKRLREAQPPAVAIVEVSEGEYEVTVGNEKMIGRKFEFPTHMETFKLFHHSSNGASAASGAGLNAAAKIADVHELLVVSRDRKTLDDMSDSLVTVDGIQMMPSGLLPPMQHVVERRFRKTHMSEAQKSSVRSAESAIMSIVGGGQLEWEDVQEVDAMPDFSRPGALEENASVWEPTSAIYEELRAAGLMDAYGNLAALSESSDDDDECASVGGSSRAPSRRTGTGVGIRIGSRYQLFSSSSRSAQHSTYKKYISYHLRHTGRVPEFQRRPVRLHELLERPLDQLHFGLALRLPHASLSHCEPSRLPCDPYY